MRKAANIILKARFIILPVMLAITLICALLIPKVEINSDMTKYLPDSSPMKTGVDLMAEEFDDMSITQTIRAMFKGLNDAEKDDILVKLKGIEYVDSVTYEKDSADYNKDDYTLYIINTTYNYGSIEERQIENTLENDFKEYNLTYKNNSTNTMDIPIWIIILAVTVLMVILFLMCSSFAEPFIFLIVIGIAIIINLGTNIFLGSISTVTFSISAILQLVLSMDYSIILMNRYRQERKIHDRKTVAMGNALANAFPSIASSGMTTVVGLIVLVFMSFKIGFDIGVVLAKGVFISMVCVFTILPGFILICDKLIAKTAKKALHIPMGGLARFSFRFRRVIAVAFIGIFIGSYILQAMTNISYQLETDDPIVEIFPSSSTLVLMYDNSDEEAVANAADQLESMDNIKNITGYSTTLGKGLTSSALSDMISEMGSDMEIDSTMLDIIYYDYFNGKLTPITVSEFINFIAEDVMKNSSFSEYLGPEVTDNFDMMMKLADKDKLTAPLSAEEIAEFFELNSNDIKKLFLYYYTTNGGADTGTMTLPQFTNFILNEVISNPEYAGMFDESSISQLRSLQVFTDSGKMTAPMSYSEIASLLGIDNDSAKLLFVYYYALSDNYTPDSMSLGTFIWFIQNYVASNPMFSSYFDAGTLTQMNTLAAYTNKDNIEKQMTSPQLGEFFSMDSAMIDQLFAMYYAVDVDSKTMSLYEFTGYLTSDIMSNPQFAPYFDDATKAQLTALHQLVSISASGSPLGSAELSAITGMDEGTVSSIFMMYGAATGTEITAMTLPDFLSVILNTPEISGLLPPETIASLTATKAIVDTAAANTQLNYSELAAFLSMDSSLAKQVFSIYFADNTAKTMSPVQFVNYLLSDVVTNAQFAQYFNEETISNLKFIQSVMKLSLAGTKLSYSDTAATFGMDSSTTKMLYTYYQSQFGSISSWRLTPQTVVNFIVNNSGTFSGMMNQSDINNLRTASKIINGSVAGTAYTPENLGELVGIESKELKSLFLLYISEHGDTSNWKLSIQTFLNFIITNVLDNEDFSSSFDSGSADELKSAKKIVDAIIEGKAYSPQEMSALLDGINSGADGSSLELLYLYKDSKINSDPNWKISLHALTGYLADNMLNDPRFDTFLTDELRSGILDMKTQVNDGLKQLKGENYSIMMLSTNHAVSDDETISFMDGIYGKLTELKGDYYIIGDIEMNYEMAKSFDGELLLITLLTAIAIFVVVALTFKSLSVPAILVLIVQCGVYITVAISGILGFSIYYMALLIVQCILMGATIDYGILFTNYYRESRQTMDIKESLAAAYNGSNHTIFTSGLIMIIITGIIGFSPVEPTIGQICQTISLGALSATLLILLILPGLLATLDRFVSGKKKEMNKP